MNESASSFESELRISLKPVLVALVVVGVAFVLLSDSLPDASKRLSVLFLAAFFFVMAVIAWLLDTWKPQVSRWFAVAVLIAAIYLGNTWLGGQAFSTLVAIPCALAAALIGPAAATVTAVGETVLLLLLPRFVTAGADIPTVTGVITVWAALGIMYAVYRPVRQQSRWLEEYFSRAQRLLEEARDRQAALEQALESVAHANRQLALASERMSKLRAIAEEAQRTKTAFVANVSHEFRTPLNMIVGLVDLMVERPEIYTVVLSPKMRKDLETIHRNCEHLSNMINDVLDLTRIETGRPALHKERVRLKEIVDSSVAALRPLMEKKQLALQVAIPDDLPEVYCDPTRIEQVILNLLSNAARFTKKGGIEVKVARQDQQILISVTDTGPGIPSEDIERIFEPFWQSTDQRRRGRGGSGLGLSISKRFIELHGGRMWLKSKAGGGTSFFFTLPASPPMERGARPGYSMREDWVWREHAFRAGRMISADQLVRPRLVICDETGALYPQLVRCSGEVEFVDARDLMQVAQALQHCPAHAVVFNSVTSDDIWPLVEAVRQQAPGTPVIGCSVPRMVQRAIDAGALGYLTKPVTRADLEGAIQSVGKPVKRVLVVDDDPDVLQLFSRTLRAWDGTLDVAIASSGREALSVLREELPDLLLLDVVMPDMDGWQVLESIAQDEEIGGVPTFFISAQDPANQPPASKFVLATVDGGVSLSKLLRCCLDLSMLFLEPERGLDLTPV